MAHRIGNKTAKQKLKNSPRNCYWCDASLNKDNVTADHIIPISIHKKGLPGNKVLACRKCNEERGIVPTYVANFKDSRVMTVGFINLAMRTARKWAKIEQEKLGYSVSDKIYGLSDEFENCEQIGQCTWCDSKDALERVAPNEHLSCVRCRKESGRIIRVMEQVKQKKLVPLTVISDTLAEAEIWERRYIDKFGQSPFTLLIEKIKLVLPKMCNDTFIINWAQP